MDKPQGDGEVRCVHCFERFWPKRGTDREMFKAMLDEYYKIHAWDENGMPAVESLKKL